MDDRATSRRVARTAAVDRVVGQLGDWAGGSGPLYRQLARALSAAVERGELERGARLPSERALAAAVAVSRGVAVAAYDLLVAEGLVERRTGSGSFVAGGAEASLPRGRVGSELVGRFVDHGSSPSVIDLSISVLHSLADLPEASVATNDLAAGDSPWGWGELRVRIAERLGAIGLPTTADQVVVTTGAQQGISIAAGCWVRPGDPVVVDDPTYPGALSAFHAAGATLLPVTVDRRGPVLDELDRALAAGPALVYLQSGTHSPTGGALSAHRRRAIVERVVEQRVPVVEDVALFAVDWSGGTPPPPLAALAPDHPIAVVGSYSKRFWAGLRVGFVRAPAPVARRLVRVKATHDLGSSSVGQALALALLDHPDHGPYLARRNAALAVRASLLADRVCDQLPGATVDVPDGGLSLWVRLPHPVAARLAEVALRHGVAVAVADGLSVVPERHRDRLRLSFALPEAVLVEGADRLGAAWRELEELSR